MSSTNYTKIENQNRSLEDLEINNNGENVTYSAILLIILVSSLSGNFIVTFTLLKKEGRLSPSNKLVFSLVSSNLIKDVTVSPLIVATSIKNQWIFGHAWCSIISFLFLLISLASILTLTAIAIDRYFAIVKTMIYRRTITSTKSLLMLLAAWIQAACCSVPPVLGFPEVAYNPVTHFCEVSWGNNWIYSGCVLVLCFFLPVSIMVFCYTIILRVASTKCRTVHMGTTNQTVENAGSHRSSISSQGNQGALGSSSPPVVNFFTKQTLTRKPSLLSLSSGSQVKGVTIVCIILGALLFSWSPYVAVILCEAVGKRVSAWFQRFSICAALTRSVTDPLVYGLLNRSIRNDIFTLLGIPQQRPFMTKRLCSEIELKESTPVDSLPASILRTSTSFECMPRTSPSRWGSQQSLEGHSSQDSGAMTSSIEEYELGTTNPSGTSITNMTSLLEVPSPSLNHKSHSVKRLSWAENTYNGQELDDGHEESVTEFQTFKATPGIEMVISREKNDATGRSKGQLPAPAPTLVVTAVVEERQILRNQEHVLEASTLTVPQASSSLATGTHRRSIDEGIVRDYSSGDPETEDCDLQPLNRPSFLKD
ncbi:G-protein coupled receptor 161-like isoform X2 [Tachypleus tridentatus]